MEKKLNIEGMSCQHCVGRVKKTIEKFECVSEAKVDLAGKEAVIICSDETIDTEGMIKEITELGFKASEKI